MEERPIAFNLLHKDELEYEVTLRGAKPAGTVAALRAQINLLNKDIPTDELVSCDLDTHSELAVIKEKLESLHLLCTGASEKTPSLKILNRIQALSHHLYHRLGRLSPEGDQITVVKALADRLEKTLIKFDNLLHNFKSSYVTTGPAPGNVETSKPELYDRHSSVHSLNTRFNGRTCVKAFLQRLEELCQSRGISETKLFNSASELFSDEALCWYRGIRSEVHDWQELKELLVSEYLPFDYDHRLMKEIRERSQGPDENIINYLGIMQNYFSRLSNPISDQEKLNIVLFNLRPFYTSQLALSPIEHWADLKHKCRLLECAKLRSESFSEPSRSSRSCLAPDLSYQGRNVKVCRVEMSAKPTEFCVRCRVHGHNLGNCSAPFSLICFRCGKKDYTARTCPRCSTNTSTQSAPKNESK